MGLGNFLQRLDCQQSLELDKKSLGYRQTVCQQQSNNWNNSFNFGSCCWCNWTFCFCSVGSHFRICFSRSGITSRHSFQILILEGVKMKNIIRAFYLIAIVFLAISFWVNIPFRFIGFLSLLIASVLALISRNKKNNY